MLTPQTLLHSVVANLLDNPAMPARLLGLGEAAALVQMVDGSLAALYCPMFGPPEAIGDTMRALVQDNPGLPLKLVLLGGPPSLRACLPHDGARLWSRRAVQLFHVVHEEGIPTVWTGAGARVDSPLGRVLTQAAAGELAVPDPVELARRVDAPAPRSEQERAEHAAGRAFIQGLKRRPYATWGILGGLAAIFLCELMWGGSETIPTLVRMGGNTDTTLEGQPWRLLSAALLHAGWLHIAANGYVLLILGGFMEKVLGAGRYGVLLGAAALGGSLASALLSSSAVSVGASGAIWGVLGAAAALAWRPGAVVPAAMVGPLRRNAVINVVINLSVSFLPQVDLWAHLGGGLVGALLVLVGGLTRGVQPLGAQGSSASSSSRVAVGWGIAAGCVAGLMLLSLGAAWAHSRPWQLGEAPHWTHHRLAVNDELAVELDVPVQLGPPTLNTSEPDQISWVFGDTLNDPLVVAVTVIPNDIDRQSFEQIVRDYDATGPATPSGATISQPWHRRPTSGAPSFEVEYTYDNGLVSGLWVQLRSHAIVRVQSVRWPLFSERWAEALPRVYDSLDHGPPN